MKPCRAGTRVVATFKIERRDADTMCITKVVSIQVEINMIAIESCMHNNTTFAIHIMPARTCVRQESNITSTA